LLSGLGEAVDEPDEESDDEDDEESDDVEPEEDELDSFGFDDPPFPPPRLSVL
jgi:hypothetical protein